MKNDQNLKNAAYDAAYEILSTNHYFEETKQRAMTAAKETGYRYWYSQFVKARCETKN